MKKNSFVEGTFIATFSIVFIKFLGAIYVIPFYNIIGESGGALYSYAYNVYNLFLNISTAGLPVAMSKIISEYNSLEMYDAKERSYKIGRNIIFILSMIAFFILFVFAKECAYLILGDITGGNTIEDVTLVIRSVSFCLLIIPFLSVSKGYLQGHKFIAPSSTSQVLEQVVRIAVILFGSYLAINILHTKVSIGVAIAVFGAFVGGLSAFIYVRTKIKKNPDKFPKPIKNDSITNKEIRNKIISYAIPLIVISIATDIYSLTDMALMLRGLTKTGYDAATSETITSIISTWGMKICMIINSVATGLTMSLIPHIVESYVKKDKASVNKTITQSIGIILVIALPIATGISFLSYPVYTIFYGPSTYGKIILRLLIFQSVFASLHIVISMVLQGLNKFSAVYKSTITGFVINAILDIPLMVLFNKIGIYPFYGATTATLIGYVISYLIAFKELKKELNYRRRTILEILYLSIAPMASLIVVILVLNIFMPITSTSRFVLIFDCLVYGVLAGSAYFVLAYKNKLLYTVFGKEYIDKIINKFRRFDNVKN